MSDWLDEPCTLCGLPRRECFANDWDRRFPDDWDQPEPIGPWRRRIGRWICHQKSVKNAAGGAS